MDNSYQIYKDKVYEFLDSMQPGDAYIVAKLSTPETRDKFIFFIKSYMDSKIWQGWLSFNRDYSKIYKIHEITFKPEKNEKPFSEQIQNPKP